MSAIGDVLNRREDPLLQPFRLRRLTLRNRGMNMAHEPHRSEDGMPKDRYRLCHVEKARGGVALSMTAKSAVVSPDSPPVPGNLLAYKDKIVSWLRRLTDECHERGSAAMIEIAHLGRRTAWNKAGWLPVLAPSPIRKPAHRAFLKAAGDRDIDPHRRWLCRRRAAHAGGRAGDQLAAGVPVFHAARLSDAATARHPPLCRRQLLHRPHL